METKKRGFDVSSAGLHIIAMASMLIDHLAKYVNYENNYVVAIGRLAFPIFAFMVVEGYFHTHNFWKYMFRMFIFAIVSEIPYNLMSSGKVFYRYDQNVMWTFMLALACIWIIDKVRGYNKKWLSILSGIIVTIAGYLISSYLMLDYLGSGILMVLIFYYLHERKWWSYILQFVLLFLVNVVMLGDGGGYALALFGYEIEIPVQAFAMFSLIPIWLYRGRQGYHSKPFQYFCYAFYPVHMLILAVLIGH
jgi:hypothetical protein